MSRGDQAFAEEALIDTEKYLMDESVEDENEGQDMALIEDFTF